MNKKATVIVAAVAAAGLVGLTTAFAQGGGKQPQQGREYVDANDNQVCDHYEDGNAGRRGGARGRVRGMQQDHRADIHTLAWNHQALERQVETLDDGIRAVTTSEDPDLVEPLRRHVRQMVKRLEDGYGVRRWDPLFRELSAQYDNVDVELEDVPAGIKVIATSDDSDTVALLKAHSDKIGDMIARGPAALHETSALPKGYESAVPGFGTGRGKGQGMQQGRGFGPGKGQSMQQGRGFGPGKGQGMQQGRGFGPGKGQGMQQGRGFGPGKGQGMQHGRGFGPGKGQGMQQRQGNRHGAKHGQQVAPRRGHRQGCCWNR